VEVGVAQAVGGQSVNVSGVYLGAIAAHVAIAKVIHQDDQYVRGAVRAVDGRVQAGVEVDMILPTSPVNPA
jgi:hypothetical protein